MSTGALRLALAGGCAAGPQVLRTLGAPDADDTVTRIAARVLAVRYVVQGVLTLVAPASPVNRVAPVVELVHAASMLPVAVVSARHRRSALCSAAAAGLVGVLDVRFRAPSPERRPPGTRG